jgi:hypothetical protein
MRPIHRLVLTALATLSLAATAACGNASAATDPSVNAPNTTMVPPGTLCERLSLDEVSEFLGQPAQVDRAGATECVWMATESGSRQLKLQMFNAYGYFAPDRWGGEPEPVEGLGEEAYLIRTGDEGTTAAYWDGQWVVVLNYVLYVGSGSSQDKADALVDLLRTVAE